MRLEHYGGLFSLLCGGKMTDREKYLEFLDKVALEVLRASLINRALHTHNDMIEYDCKLAYKYADTLWKVREKY